jgi:hypothetical protein
MSAIAAVPRDQLFMTAILPNDELIVVGPLPRRSNAVLTSGVGQP